MDMENQKIEEEQMSLFENDDTKDKVVENEANGTDELKGAIEETLSKIRRQSMLLGAQVMLQTVLDKITAFERKPGSKSNNDHKRLIKDIKKFCEIGLSRKIDENGETTPVDETAQN